MARRVVLYYEKYTPQPAHVQLGTPQPAHVQLGTSVTEGLSLAMQIIQLQMLFAHTTDIFSLRYVQGVCPSLWTHSAHGASRAGGGDVASIRESLC